MFYSSDVFHDSGTLGVNLVETFSRSQFCFGCPVRRLCEIRIDFGYYFYFLTQSCVWYLKHSEWYLMVR